jgi:outer membrane immunogenic protein
MKKLLLGTVALAALGVPAIAADMGVRPVYRPVVAYTNWTGCHIGGLVGIEYGRETSTTTGSSIIVAQGPISGAFNGAAVFPGQQVHSPFNTSGFTGGGYAGCDYQVSNWVVGVEGDWSNSNNSGQSGPQVAAFQTNLGLAAVNPFSYHETQERWYATVRGRLGYAIDKWLFFVSGGGAWTKIDTSTFDVVSPGNVSIVNKFDLATNRVSGWTVGGGFDYAITGASLMPGWSVRVEYLYIKFQDYTINPNVLSTGVVPPGAPGAGTPLNIAHTIGSSNSFSDQVIRVGFAYKFGNFAAGYR